MRRYLFQAVVADGSVSYNMVASFGDDGIEELSPFDVEIHSTEFVNGILFSGDDPSAAIDSSRCQSLDALISDLLPRSEALGTASLWKISLSPRSCVRLSEA